MVLLDLEQILPELVTPYLHFFANILKIIPKVILMSHKYSLKYTSVLYLANSNVDFDWSIKYKKLNLQFEDY